MAIRSINGELVMEYIKKFPHASNRSLARKIYFDGDNYMLFTSTESVRVLIRHYKGCNGKESRKFKITQDDTKSI